jgi:hypothetical protein
LGIDTRDIGFALPGDNRAYLGTIDLDKFDVIDLDAYGIPFDQVEVILNRGYQGVIFVTFIQSVYGCLPNAMLSALGYPMAGVKKIPTIFYKHGWEKMLLYLANRGLKTVVHRSFRNKHYFMINGAEAGGEGCDTRMEGIFADLS